MADEPGHSTSEPAGENAPAPRKRRPRLTAVAKVTRDAAIMAALHANTPVKDVAQRYAITQRQVRRIYDEFKLRRSALDVEPMQIVERVLRTYESQMEAALALAASTADSMPAVAISAVKTHTQLLERYVQLLSDVGKLPDNLAMFRQEAEMRRIAELMAQVLAEVESGERSAFDARAFFRRLLDEPVDRLLSIEATSSWEDETPDEGEAA